MSTIGTVGSLNVALKGDAQGLNKAVADAKAALSSVGTQAQATGTSVDSAFKKAGDTAATFASILSGSAVSGGGFGTLAITAAKMAGDFARAKQDFFDIDRTARSATFSTVTGVDSLTSGPIRQSARALAQSRDAALQASADAKQKQLDEKYSGNPAKFAAAPSDEEIDRSYVARQKDINASFDRAESILQRRNTELRQQAVQEQEAVNRTVGAASTTPKAELAAQRSNTIDAVSGELGRLKARQGDYSVTSPDYFFIGEIIKGKEKELALEIQLFDRLQKRMDVMQKLAQLSANIAASTQIYQSSPLSDISFSSDAAMANGVTDLDTIASRLAGMP